MYYEQTTSIQYVCSRVDVVNSHFSYMYCVLTHYTALLWQKEISDKSEISCKRVKCVFISTDVDGNIMMSHLTYLIAG